MPLEYTEISIYVSYSNNTNNINNMLASPNLEPLVISYQVK